MPEIYHITDHGDVHINAVYSLEKKLIRHAVGDGRLPPNSVIQSNFVYVYITLCYVFGGRKSLVKPVMRQKTCNYYIKCCSVLPPEIVMHDASADAKNETNRHRHLSFSS